MEISTGSGATPVSLLENIKKESLDILWSQCQAAGILVRVRLDPASHAE